jgi:DNA-binding CsgD family transcriptional regulator
MEQPENTHETFHPLTDSATGLEIKRQKARDRARAHKAARRQFVSEEELQQCRSDLRKAKTIRPGLIVCLGRRDQNCGQILQALRAKGAGAHLREHGFIDGSQYREHWGYSRGTSLVGDALAAMQRARAKERGHLRPDAGLTNLRSPAKGRVMSEEFRQKQINRTRTRPKFSESRDGMIVSLWVAGGQTIKEIANEVKLSEGRIHALLRRIYGVRVKQRVAFAHAEIITGGFSDELSGRFNFRKKEIARLLKFSADRMKFSVEHRSDRALTQERADFLLNAERELTQTLLRATENKPGYFRTVVPQLGRFYGHVLRTIKLVATCGNLESAIDELCRQSQQEIGEADRPAWTSLCLLSSLLPWLRLQPSSDKPFALAQRFVAKDYGVPVWIVEKALKLDEDALPSRESVRSILTASVPRKNAVGRPEGMTKERIEEGRKLEASIKKHGGKRGALRKAVPEVYPGISEIVAYDRARQTLKDYRTWKTTKRENN